MMTKLKKTIRPVPEDNKSHKGPGSTPEVPVDTTRAIATMKNTTSASRPGTAT